MIKNCFEFKFFRLKGKGSSENSRRRIQEKNENWKQLAIQNVELIGWKLFFLLQYINLIVVGLFFNSLTAVANETPHISNSSATKKAQQRCIYNYCMYFIYIMLWFIYAKEFIPIKKERKKVEQKMLLCRVGYWTHTWRGGKTSFKAFIPSPSVLFNNEFCQRVIHRVAGYLVPICLILAGYPVQVCQFQSDYFA